MTQHTKAQLIEICRAHGLATGDTARNSKEHYEALLRDAGVDVGAVQPAPAAAAQPAAGPDVNQVAALLAQLLGSGAVNADRVAEIVEAQLAPVREQLAALENQEPRRLEVRTVDSTAVLEEHRHPLFEKVTRLISAGLNVALVGPAGCGKSHLSAQVARALDRRFGEINCSAGTSESELTGYLLPTGEAGRFEYSAVPFVECYEQGGVFMFDELDAADPNMLLVVNSALANGHLNLPKRLGGHRAIRHPHFAALAGLNTFGQGADALYTGRNALDQASVDRWYVVKVDYDPALEAKIAGIKIKPAADWAPASDDPAQVAADIAELGQWALTLREKAMRGRLRRVVSTRMLQKAAAARRALVPVAEIKADLLAGWTADELAKVGE